MDKYSQLQKLVEDIVWTTPIGWNLLSHSDAEGNPANLMQFRATKILLVASPYELFLMEDDASDSSYQSSSQLKVRGMSSIDSMFQSAPFITRVSTLVRALENIRSLEKNKKRKYDLIITLTQFNDAKMSKLVHSLRKAAGPDVPLFPLCTTLLPESVNLNATNTHKSSQKLGSSNSLTQLHSSQMTDPIKPYESHSAIVGPLVISNPWKWSGEGSLFSTLMMMVEDARNVNEDTRLGVGVILYVENDAVYYSQILPFIYLILQSYGNSGVNSQHRLFNKAARLKVIHVHTFEEALSIVHRYKDDIIGLICDIDIICSDQKNSTQSILKSTNIIENKLEQILSDKDIQKSQQDKVASQEQKKKKVLKTITGLYQLGNSKENQLVNKMIRKNAGWELKQIIGNKGGTLFLTQSDKTPIPPNFFLKALNKINEKQSNKLKQSSNVGGSSQLTVIEQWNRSSKYTAEKEVNSLIQDLLPMGINWICKDNKKMNQLVKNETEKDISRIKELIKQQKLKEIEKTKNQSKTNLISPSKEKQINMKELLKYVQMKIQMRLDDNADLETDSISTPRSLSQAQLQTPSQSKAQLPILKQPSVISLNAHPLQWNESIQSFARLAPSYSQNFSLQQTDSYSSFNFNYPNQQSQSQLFHSQFSQSQLQQYQTSQTKQSQLQTTQIDNYVKFVISLFIDENVGMGQFIFRKIMKSKEERLKLDEQIIEKKDEKQIANHFVRSKAVITRSLCGLLSSSKEGIHLRAQTMDELFDAIMNVPTESVAYHSYRNDFSNWLYAKGEVGLAFLLRSVDAQASIFYDNMNQDQINQQQSQIQQQQQTQLNPNQQQISSISNQTLLESVKRMRVFLQEAYRHYRTRHTMGVARSFKKEIVQKEANFFLKIGKGSLGGKARGVLFLERLLAVRKHYFQGCTVRLPRSIVLCSDIFENYVNYNGLGYLAYLNEDDDYEDDEEESQQNSDKIDNQIISVKSKQSLNINQNMIESVVSPIKDIHQIPFSPQAKVPSQISIALPTSLSVPDQIQNPKANMQSSYPDSQQSVSEMRQDFSNSTLSFALSPGLIKIKEETEKY